MATLKLGSSGIAVKELQKELVKLGFASVPTSGNFDLPTQAAVIEFQKSRVWLVADGIVGPISQAELDSAVKDVDGETTLHVIASGTTSLNISAIDANVPLAKKVQKKLNALGLYPGGKLIDGDFGPRSQKALTDFCQSQVIPTSEPVQLSPTIAQALINTLQIPNVLEVRGKDTSQILKKYKDIEQFIGANDNKLAFLDMGVEATAYKTDIPEYSKRLTNTVSLIIPTSAHPSLTFSTYPDRGKLASINTNALKFLDASITEACVVIGQINSGKLETAWLGKNALKADECLSSTKIIPILNVLSQLGNNLPKDLNNLLIQNQGIVNKTIRLPAALIDVVSYRAGVPHSNGLAKTFKLFSSPAQIETWIRKQTGNNNPSLSFEGPYGPFSFINLPEIFDLEINDERLQPPVISLGIDNDISVYDLARLISMLGWHQLLPTPSQLETIQWRGLEPFIKALGTDTARYFDVAVETLGLVNVLSSPVILSKLGYGNEALVYIAFVQFVDVHIPTSPKLRTFTIALRTDKNPPDASQAIPSDTKMAAAVTEIVRRIVMEEPL
jgi:peptidoglycan hydrolase-like protein with peptidoglycan-binding domain